MIARDEVASWLAGSVNQRITYHRTTPEAATAIRRSGVSVLVSRIGSFGQGFYTSTVPDDFYGDAEVSVAIRLLSPLIGDESYVGSVVDQLTAELGGPGTALTPAVAAGVHRALIAMGYDGIIAYNAAGDGVDYVIAFAANQVRVVMS